MARAAKPVEKVMATMYQNCSIVRAPSEDVLPEKNTKIRAKIGAMPKRAAVTCKDEVFFRAYFEKAVELPQAAAAPAANKAATKVPLPVFRLTVKSGKDTK